MKSYFEMSFSYPEVIGSFETLDVHDPWVVRPNISATKSS